jgi:hypothetical protein
MTRARLVVIAAVGVAVGAMAEGNARAGLCPGWGCGANSATIGDELVFDELSVKPNVQNDAGMFLKKVVLKPPFTNPGTLVVTKDRLSAKDAAGKVVQGDDLKGTVIVIGHVDGREFELQVKDAVETCKASNNNCLTYWATPNDANDAANNVPYYEFKVRKTKLKNNNPGGPQDGPKEDSFARSLCKTPNSLIKYLVEAKQWIRAAKESAVVFTGDHYDAATKEVEAGSADRFNLGCAGTVPAKLHLLRHTEAGSIPIGTNKRTTSLPERTAMLRMLIADYCGNGTKFTFDGVLLNYGDVKGWYPLPPDGPMTTKQPTPRDRSFEAVWNSKGPLCLTDPRVACPEEIVKNCRDSLDDQTWNLPKKCPVDGSMPWEDGHALSANPKGTQAPICASAKKHKKKKGREATKEAD